MGETTIVPKWLRSSKVNGLDQLGVQVVSIALYSDLLPGITNVTDRIRYYSFFPWVLYRYAKEIKKLDLITWQEHLRRAEFLLALVGRNHHKDSYDGGEAIVGADQAGKALTEIEQGPNKTWKLSKWSSLTNAGEKGSYFKNKNGGFGQYYRGQLASLGLIFQDESPLGVKLSSDAGVEIAEICDSQPGRSEFWKAVKSDKITLDTIVSLGDSICPCAIRDFQDERQFLVQLLFGPDSHANPSSTNRANSLRLLLAVLDQGNGFESPVSEFRHLTYFEHDDSGKRFRVPSQSMQTFNKWCVYQTGEFVNYSLEIAFDALLDLLAPFDVDGIAANQFISDTVETALKVSESDLSLGDGDAIWSELSLADLVGLARSHQRDPSEWANDPWSEHSLLFENIKNEEPLVCLAKSFAGLVAIQARNKLDSISFDSFAGVPPDWLRKHKVTLTTINSFLSENASEKCSKVFAQLIQDFVIGQHLRVAMRKLRHDAQSTFKLTIEGGKLIWLDNFQPTLTNPRLRQAFRFLRDLRLCQGSDGEWKITPAGRSQMRISDGD